MDNKKILIGGLAIVGALALFMYLKPKPKKNSEGFFNAQGKSGACAQCENEGAYYRAKNGSCGRGRCISKYA